MCATAAALSAYPERGQKRTVQSSPVTCTTAHIGLNLYSLSPGVLLEKPRHRRGHSEPPLGVLLILPHSLPPANPTSGKAPRGPNPKNSHYHLLEIKS